MNGQIVYTTDPDYNHTVDTIATYSCNEGYALVGDKQRVCVDDDQLDTIGQWNGSVSCEGELFEPATEIHICPTHFVYNTCISPLAAIVCPALDELENGQITYDVDNATDFALDTIAMHTCNKGYSLVGQFIRTCMDDDQMDTIGVWSEVAPSCQGIVILLRCTVPISEKQNINYSAQISHVQH